MYAIECDGVVLVDQFLEKLYHLNPSIAQQLVTFIEYLLTLEYISPDRLRFEMSPGIYAMYKHNGILSNPISYCPARLLCCYLGSKATTMLIGSGGLKTKNVSIQQWPELLKDALFISKVARQVETRLDFGVVGIDSSGVLVVSDVDELTFEL